jgi:cell division septum initiation protein DivIVA
MKDKKAAESFDTEKDDLKREVDTLKQELKDLKQEDKTPPPA